MILDEFLLCAVKPLYVRSLLLRLGNIPLWGNVA